MEKITLSVITYNIIHTMLLLPIPNMLLIERQLFAIGSQSSSNMINQFETGLDHNLILINQFLQIYLILLSIMLIILTKRFDKKKLQVNFWFFLIMIVNVGVLQLEFNSTKLVYLAIFSILLLCGKFKNTMIKPVYLTLMVVYFYFSFILIKMIPSATIFNDGSWTGIFINPNGIAIVSAFTIILILLNIEESRVKIKHWHYIHIMFILFMIVMSGSRNGQLTCLVILSLYGIIKYKLKTFVSVILISVSIILIFITSFFNDIDLVEFTSMRWSIWENAFESLKGNLIFGVGNDFYSLNNRIHKLSDDLLFASSSYSSFVDYILFYGFFGLILITGFINYLFKRLKLMNKYYIIFFILFIIPNLLESYFKPPILDINNVLFLISLLIINSNSKELKIYLKKKNV